MFDNVLTLIAAVEGNGLIELAANSVYDALTSFGALVSPPDWLAPRRACDLFFTGVSDERAEARIRTLFAERLADAKLDFIVQESVNRRKRLIAADLESTLIENEMLDELASFIGVRSEVTEITRQAMNGEIDFATALKTRVALFTGLPETVIEEAAARIRLTSGASTLAATSQAHGACFAIITGGFSIFARHVRSLLNYDTVVANELVVESGRLTGTVREPILTREGKRAALISLAAERNIPIQLTLAIGDGANDLPMLEAAGLGVAFHAKPSVAGRARYRVDHGDLTSVLYAQGYRAAEFVAA